MEKEKKLALITRPRVDAVNLEKELADFGIESFIEPLLEIHYYQNASKIIRPYLDSCQAIVATSANAIRAVGYAKKAIITVGDKTAKLAKEHDYEEVYSSSGNVESLQKYVEDNFSPNDGGLLYISGDVISQKLSPEGFKTMRVIVYNSLPVEKLSKKCISYLENKLFDYVFFYSKKTAEVFQEKAAEYDLSNTKCICLSDSIKQAVEGMNFKEFVVSPKIDKETMLELIKDSK